MTMVLKTAGSIGVSKANVKPEHEAEYYIGDDSSLAMDQAPVTMASDRLTTIIFPYDHIYIFLLLPNFETKPGKLCGDIGI
ncbi:hypothetical protein BS50DRAFT_417880 [Corynespora cassiicola Philippines]|uniref:Uncharacterized protein n=1 Tax=Corynespora cassiicola Philippines TaxID=1448308 RepID=A0A2T2N0W0_CORCC|nr:hypothetical protein BS50DRAFT_417880 [Corynespora cassiicola Philippines]